jgi:putative colanic acid biosysnthesis UDP-glucose lipid carrier transferase
MVEQVVVKKSVLIGLISLLQVVAQGAVAVGCLYLVNRSFDMAFNADFAALAAVVMVLSLALLQRPRELETRLVGERGALVIGVILRWLLLLGCLLAIGYVTKISATYSRRVVLTWAVLTPAALIVVVLALHELMRRILSNPANARHVVIAGVNEISVTIAERLQKNPDTCMSVDGFFDDRCAERLGAGNARLVGRLPDLAPYVKRHNTDMILVALPIRHLDRVMNLVNELRDTTASIYYVPDIFVFDLIQARTTDIVGIPVIAMCETPFSGHRGVVKRLTDLCISLALLPPLLPVMAVIAVLVKLSSPGPLIFRQRRYGLDGREIMIYKFRTMTVTEDGAQIQQATRDDKRITPIGRFLRRYSLDELPQLVNVFQGTMSLVGPRPHAVAHNEEYRKLITGYMLRHKVRPGITGLAQINGCRGETAKLEQMQARVNYDLEYLRHWSLLLDMKILAHTLLQLLLRSEKAY